MVGVLWAKMDPTCVYVSEAENPFPPRKLPLTIMPHLGDVVPEDMQNSKTITATLRGTTVRLRYIRTVRDGAKEELWIFVPGHNGTRLLSLGSCECLLPPHAERGGGARAGPMRGVGSATPADRQPSLDELKKAWPEKEQPFALKPEEVPMPVKDDDLLGKYDAFISVDVSSHVHFHTSINNNEVKFTAPDDNQAAAYVINKRMNNVAVEIFDYARKSVRRLPLRTSTTETALLSNVHSYCFRESYSPHRFALAKCAFVAIRKNKNKDTDFDGDSVYILAYLPSPSKNSFDLCIGKRPTSGYDRNSVMYSLADAEPHASLLEFIEKRNDEWETYNGEEEMKARYASSPGYTIVKTKTVDGGVLATTRTHTLYILDDFSYLRDALLFLPIFAPHKEQQLRGMTVENMLDVKTTKDGFFLDIVIEELRRPLYSYGFTYAALARGTRYVINADGEEVLGLQTGDDYIELPLVLSGSGGTPIERKLDVCLKASKLMDQFGEDGTIKSMLQLKGDTSKRLMIQRAVIVGVRDVFTLLTGSVQKLVLVYLPLERDSTQLHLCVGKLLEFRSGRPYNPGVFSCMEPLRAHALMPARPFSSFVNGVVSKYPWTNMDDDIYSEKKERVVELLNVNLRHMSGVTYADWKYL